MKPLRAILAGLTNALLVASVLAWNVQSALAQTAALVPNAKQQFFNANGQPLAGGSVYSYVPNTTTPKTTWSDPFESTPNAQPVTLDAGGGAFIFGQGNYRQIVKDASGNLIWDGFTSAYGSSAPSGATGTDTAPVGTILPWSGFDFNVPTNWMLAYGEAISRSTYAQLETAITISTTTGNCTSGSETVTGFTDTSQIPVGAAIESSCLPTGTTVSSVTNITTIVVSQNATATGTFTATVFPWGNGDGVTTFNVPDLRGRVLPGADAMGGTAADRLTSAYYGASAAAPGVAGGKQNESASTTLAAANIPQVSTTYTPAGSIGQSFGNVVTAVGTGSSTGFTSPGGSSTLLASNATLSGSAFSFGGTQATITVGSASPSAAASANFATIQPSLTMNWIIKVAPNTTGAGGVTSLGGMFGDIVCNSTLTCAPAGSPSVNTIGCTTMTLSQIGCAKPDGITVVISGGVLSALGSAATSIDAAGATSGTTVVSGNAGAILYQANSGGTNYLTNSANLTFNGSLLTINAAADSKLSLTGSGSPRISLVSNSTNEYDLDVVGGFRVDNATASRTEMQFDGAGNVGIGGAITAGTLTGATLSVLNNSSPFTASLTTNQSNTGLELVNTASGGRNWIVGSGAAASSLSPSGFFVYDNTATATRLKINSTGDMTAFGNAYIGGGRPWADVRSGANTCINGQVSCATMGLTVGQACPAAAGNNSTNDYAAIQCQINYMGATFAGGVVFLPCGSYITNSTIVNPYAILLVGEGPSCSDIKVTSDLLAYQIENTSEQIHQAGFRDIAFYCDQSSGATNDCVEVDNCIDCAFDNFQIEGGNWALHICGSCGFPGGYGSGGDSTYRKGLISGWGSSGGAIYMQDSGNWFYDIKADTVGQTQAWSLYITTNLPANDIEESDFFRIDLQSTNGVFISDANKSTVAAFFHPIGWHAGSNFGTLSDLMIDGAEITGGFTVANGNLTVVNSHGIGGTFGMAVTTGSCHTAANVNLTNGGSCTSP